MTEPSHNPFANLEVPVEEDYLHCIRCGTCLYNCPTYRESVRETDSPRGRIFLARKVLEGEAKLTPNLIEQMYRCLACGACNEICPVGNRPADMALQLRWLAQQVEPAGWKQVVFHQLLAKPGLMELGTLPLRLYQLLGFRTVANALRLTSLLPRQLRDMERQLPKVPARPARSRVPSITQATGQGAPKSRVGYFLGCAQNLLFYPGATAVVRVLARNQNQVVTPESAQCCGMPAIGYGDWDALRAFARHNVQLFEKLDVDVIVTDCATCGSTLKEYKHYLASDPQWAERANAFSSKVQDISEYLASCDLVKPEGRVEGRVTYHDPCHLVRAQRVSAQPRKLLQLIDGLEFVEMNEANWCCGSAGSQIITHYETSMAVLDKKMANVAATEADYIASGCPGCQMQLTVGVKRSGLRAKVVHPVQLLDWAYEQHQR
jgi:glycolate oxidase iron-sulfur subunit